MEYVGRNKALRSYGIGLIFVVDEATRPSSPPPMSLVADLATDWKDCRGAVQSLGDFGYMGTYVGRNKASQSYGTPRSLLGLNRLVSK